MKKKIKYLIFILSAVSFLFLFTTATNADHAGGTCNPQSGPAICRWSNSNHNYCIEECKAPWIKGDCSAGDRLNCIESRAECSCPNGGVPCHRGNGRCIPGGPADLCNSPSDCADGYACTNIGRPGEPTVCWKSECGGGTTPTPALPPPSCEITTPPCIALGQPVTFSATSTNSTRMGIYKKPLAPGNWSTVADTGTCNPYSGSCSGSTIFDSTGEYEVVCNAYNDTNGLKCSGNPWCDYNPSPNQPPISCPGVSDCTSNDRVRVTVVESCAGPQPPTCTVTVPTCIEVGTPAQFSATSTNSTRMGIYKSSVPHPTGGQTWQEIADGSFTFTSIGQHEIVCNAYNDTNGLKCTGNPWCYDANNNFICTDFTDCTSADRYTINVVQSCQPPTITPTITTTITPTTTPPITITPPVDCKSYAVHETSGTGSKYLSYRLDPGPANLTMLGAFCPKCDVESMDNQPGTDVIYTIANDENISGARLCILNKSSGTLEGCKATQDRIVGLSFRPSDGILWGWKDGSGLVTINLSDGTQTPVLNSALDIQGIAWDNNGAFLYAAKDNGDKNNSELYKYDPQNSSFYSIGALTSDQKSTDAIDFSPDGWLVGNYRLNGVKIFAYNVSTNQLSNTFWNINTSNNNWDAMTAMCPINVSAAAQLQGYFAPAYTPPPYTSYQPIRINTNINPAYKISVSAQLVGTSASVECFNAVADTSPIGTEATPRICNNLQTGKNYIFSVVGLDCSSGKCQPITPSVPSLQVIPTDSTVILNITFPAAPAAASPGSSGIINPADLTNATWETQMNNYISGSCDATCVSKFISETFQCHVPGLQKQTCDPTRGECQIFASPCYFQNVGP